MIWLAWKFGVMVEAYRLARLQWSYKSVRKELLGK